MIFCVRLFKTATFLLGRNSGKRTVIWRTGTQQRKTGIHGVPKSYLGNYKRRVEEAS
jgi:hypothetical protein